MFWSEGTRGRKVLSSFDVWRKQKIFEQSLHQRAFLFFSKLMNWRANDRISYRIHFFLLYYNRMNQSKSNDSLSYSSPSTLISSARLKTIMLVALVYSFFFIDRRYDDVRWSIIISNWTVKNKFRFARIKLKISEKKKWTFFRVLFVFQIPRALSPLRLFFSVIN